MMMENDMSMENKNTIHMHPDWTHTQLVVQQQVITTNHQCAVTDDIRLSIIASVSLKPGIWDSQREKTVGPSRKELFLEVTREVNEQHAVDPPLAPEEVEKQWKNLKDTYIKTRKKVTYTPEGTTITPKWKFYSSLSFLENLFRHNTPKRRFEDEEQMNMQVHTMKRMRDDEVEEDDEYMGFCRSLVYPLREIGFKDRVQLIKLQKSIRDLIHDTHLMVLTGGHHH